MSLLSENKKVAASLIDEALHTTPTRAKKIAIAWKTPQINVCIRPYTPDEALSLIIETDLSKSGYQLLRTQAKERGADLYPSYNRVREAKAKCYPSNDNITVSESSSEIKLQALLDHTVTRIINLQTEVLMSLHSSSLKKLHLISKWGFDGSSKQSMYKQSSVNKELVDSELFMTCLVPLQLYCRESEGGQKIIIWQNPRPSSPRFTRPIKLEFIKESHEIITKEKQTMDVQIQSLVPTVIQDYETISVDHQLCMTMVDGKVCNVLANTRSSQNCYMCGANPKIMNNIDKMLQQSINPDYLEFGLSTLHAYIRFMEWLLHVAYRLGTKTWHKRKAFADDITARQKEIQRRFKSDMGLLIDIIKQGFGTTNDGNTARIFFQNSSMSASITGLNEMLIFRCNVILRALSCGYAVNAKAFHEYAVTTARLYVQEYSWYPMPASVHKILIHGSEVIAIALLPIGMLSEEAQEARNKDFRRYREMHCRKISRTATNEDLLHTMLTSSDPVISSLRKHPPKKGGHFSVEILSLLENENVSADVCCGREDDDNDDDNDDV